MSAREDCKGCQNNQHQCLCPNADCKNHGKCCDCVAAHRKAGNPPLCMREKQE